LSEHPRRQKEAGAARGRAAGPLSVALRLYDRLIEGLAVLAAASFVFVTVAIVTDVMLRNLGITSLIWVSAVVEYCMLFAAMAAGPWLIRIGGHVAVTSFVDMLPGSLRRAVGLSVMLVSVVILVWLSWRAAVIGLEEARFGSIDMRSIDIPGWLPYALLSGGFVLMAAEILRQIGRGARDLGSRAQH
jgi:TRAP-type C4-dicarboxylate transport system permease small subunit